MPRFGLTPQEVELKKIISARLNAQLAKTPYKKADVVRQTGISESTVYDYFSRSRQHFCAQVRRRQYGTIHTRW